jgi:hypothetical protein
MTCRDQTSVHRALSFVDAQIGDELRHSHQPVNLIKRQVFDIASHYIIGGFDKFRLSQKLYRRSPLRFYL